LEPSQAVSTATAPDLAWDIRNLITRFVERCGREELQFILSASRGLSVNAIAEAMGLSAPSIYRLRATVREKLARQLSGSDDESLLESRRQVSVSKGRKTGLSALRASVIKLLEQNCDVAPDKSGFDRPP
jgi:hypothetical protein